MKTKAEQAPATRNPQLRNIPSGSTGHAAVRSIRQNRNRAVGVTTSSARTGQASHPISLPSRVPMIRHIIPMAIATVPLRSKAGPCFENGGSRSRKRNARTRAATMNGTLPRKAHSQSKPSQPDATSNPAPMVPPTMPRAWLPVVNPMLRPRRCAGKRFGRDGRGHRVHT